MGVGQSWDRWILPQGQVSGWGGPKMTGKAEEREGDAEGWQVDPSWRGLGPSGPHLS